MGVCFFFRDHQAQLIGDRDYGAEFSTGLPDSIAIVVVKRAAILSCWNCVYVYARQPTLLQCIPRVKRCQQERKSEIGAEQLHNRHNGNLIHCDLRNESNQMRHPNLHYTRNAKQIKVTQRKQTLLLLAKQLHHVRLILLDFIIVVVCVQPLHSRKGDGRH